MPAYRSADEAEIRDAVVARLRLQRPSARIIHEIQNACQGPNRIDVLAVTETEIIAVEVKSKKDKIDRLSAQVAAMRGCAHHVIAALHEKFLIPNSIAYPDCGEKTRHCLNPPKDARGAEVWAWPEAGAESGRQYGCARWQDLRPSIMTPLPHTALDMLWAGELVTLCRDLGLSVRNNTTRGFCMQTIRWNATGSQITKGVCAALRRRACIEADPIIEVAA